MSTLMKILTGILGILAVIACVATIGIIGYTMTGGSFEKEEVAEEAMEEAEVSSGEAEEVHATPAVEMEAEEDGVPVETPKPMDNEEADDNHVHDYEEVIEESATCYRAGRMKYVCDCGDSYYVDIPSTGHVEDSWEIERKATEEKDGLRVKRCIYCDEIVAQEVIPYGSEDESKTEAETHYHAYVASIEREPSCILAGLRKYSCVCGSFYTEGIPAMGHVVSDWTQAEEPTSTTLGREQRTCSVCGVIVDSRPVSMLSASASLTASPSATVSTTTASPSATASATATPGSSTAASASASPTATAHSHSYTSYVLKEATCSEKGMRSFVCNCGSSYAELIELDSNNHSYKAVVTAPTSNSSGFTTYTCIWCAYSYVDNYVPAIK